MADDKELDDIVRGFSLPLKPKTYGKNYEFPEDATRLSIEEIGDWMLKLSAYRGYVLSLYIRYEIKRRMLEENYKIKLAEESRKIDSKTVKEKMNEAILVPAVREIHKKMMSREKDSMFCKGLADIYTGQIETLSRELTRKQMLKEL